MGTKITDQNESPFSAIGAGKRAKIFKDLQDAHDSVICRNKDRDPSLHDFLVTHGER